MNERDKNVGRRQKLGISFGSNRSGFIGVFGPKNPNLLPQNRGMGNVAQEKIDQLSNIAARKSIEACRADGHTVHIWNRNFRGSFICTCNSTARNKVGELRAEDPNLSPGVPETNRDIDKVLDRPSINTASGSGLFLRLRGEDPLLSNNVMSAAEPSEHGFNVDTSPEFEASAITDQSVPILNEGPKDRVELDDFADLLGLIGGGDLNVCGVCYGTGFVDGYKFVEGERIVLTNQIQFPVKDMALNGADLDLTAHPNTFRLNRSEQNVIWTLELPLFIKVLAIRLKNNIEDAKDFSLEGSVDGINWQTVDITWLSTKSCSTVKLRVKPNKTKLDEGVLVFTHIEIVLQQRFEIYAQLPQLSRNLNLENLEAVITEEFEVEPSIPLLNRESLIEFPSIGILGKVTQVTNKSTSKNVLFGIIGTLRVVQPSEKLNIARLGEDRDKVFSPFRGVENTTGEIDPGLKGDFNPKEYTATSINPDTTLKIRG